jgi:transglutaminase-like putative cysteine protease
MTDALAVLGLLALLTSGELNPWVSAAVVAGLLVALLLPGRYKNPQFLRWAGVVAPIGLLGTQLVRLGLGHDPIPVIIEFAAGLQVIRLATRRGAAHDQQVIILSLLHLIAGTVLGGGLAYGLSFVGFLVLTPGALVLSHLRREVEGNYRQGARDRTGLPVDVPRILRSRRVIGRNFLLFTCLLSVPVFLFTAILFLAFPRVGMSLLMVQPIRPTRVVGFSERVDLGGIGKLRTDPALAMRVTYDKLPEDAPVRLNLYLRGAVFDQYDGSTWSRSPQSGGGPDQFGSWIALTRAPDPARDRRMRIQLEPIDPPVVFVPSDAVALSVVTGRAELGVRRTAQVFAGAYGELRYAGGVDKGGLTYDVYLRKENERTREGLSRTEMARYLQTPLKLSPKVRELAEELTRDAKTPQVAARAIENELRTRYRYDLESPSGAAPDPLYDFLFVSKRGHCEFYSTAMAMMLRSLGIPARNATGFVGGTLNRFGGFYAVRQGDAHSWVEAYMPGQGWTRFDPTPPSSAAPQGDATGLVAFLREAVEAASQRWSEHVVGYNLDKQLSYWRAVRQQWRGIATPREASTEGRAGNARIIGLVVGAVAMGAGAWWLLRRKRVRTTDPLGPELAPSAARPIELYRRLEAALQAREVPRPRAVPPLLHAQALFAAGHPTGPEALALTELYLRARFGGIPLTHAEDKDFLRRVRALRSEKNARSADDAAPDSERTRAA